MVPVKFLCGYSRYVGWCGTCASADPPIIADRRYRASVALSAVHLDHTHSNPGTRRSRLSAAHPDIISAGIAILKVVFSRH